MTEKLKHKTCNQLKKSKYLQKLKKLTPQGKKKLKKKFDRGKENFRINN